MFFDKFELTLKKKNYKFLIPKYELIILPTLAFNQLHMQEICERKKFHFFLNIYYTYYYLEILIEIDLFFFGKINIFRRKTEVFGRKILKSFG